MKAYSFIIYFIILIFSCPAEILKEVHDLEPIKILKISYGIVFDKNFNEYVLLFAKEKTSQKFEFTGSLMFYVTNENLFYLGVNDWGGSGHTGYIYCWELNYS